MTPHPLSHPSEGTWPKIKWWGRGPWSSRRHSHACLANGVEPARILQRAPHMPQWSRAPSTGSVFVSRIRYRVGRRMTRYTFAVHPHEMCKRFYSSGKTEDGLIKDLFSILATYVSGSQPSPNK